jgi:hypothetical protein
LYADYNSSGFPFHEKDKLLLGIGGWEGKVVNGYIRNEFYYEMSTFNTIPWVRQLDSENK